MCFFVAGWGGVGRIGRVQSFLLLMVVCYDLSTFNAEVKGTVLLLSFFFLSVFLLLLLSFFLSFFFLSSSSFFLKQLSGC